MGHGFDFGSPTIVGRVPGSPTVRLILILIFFSLLLIVVVVDLVRGCWLLATMMGGCGGCGMGGCGCGGWMWRFFFFFVVVCS